MRGKSKGWVQRDEAQQCSGQTWHSRCQGHGRVEEREEEDGPAVRLEVAVEGLVEAAGHALLAAEHLDDPDAVQDLLQVAVEAREARADLPVGAAGAAADAR